MSLGSNIDTLEIKNADKIKFIGTSNTVVDTTTGRIGIGTDTPEDALHVNGGIRFGGHIIPLNNAAFDIGSAENKIRDMYVDTNSLWIGDTTKIAFSGGKMKFKRRKVDKVPRMLLTLAIGHNPAKDENAVEVDAVSFAKTIDPTITTISDLKLQHWRDFTKTFDESKSISDIFVDNDEDYEAITASEAFMEVGSNIFTEHSLSIGKTTDPVSALDVVGDINLTGSLLINGVEQTFGDGVVSSQWSDIESTTDISYSSGNVGIGITPQAKLHVDGNTIITGNLTVSGTTTTVDTDNLRVRDPIIELGKDNTDSPIVDLGLVMTRPTGESNVAIIYDTSENRLEIGYTQSNASDSTITIENAVDNPLHVNVNGVLSGDGSGLTALNAGNIASGTIEAARIPDIWSNLASNVTRITSLETSNADIWSNLASNVTRIGILETNTEITSDQILSLETSNADIWSNLASNVTRIASLETSNTDIWSNLASNVTRIASLETSNTDIWSNLASNVTRIASLETSNADIWSNLASNVTRIASLETSNADIWSNLASNVTRIASLETSNADIWSNLASNVTRIASLETSNTDIWSNLASNVTRIASLETSNTDIWSNLASNVTRIASLETSNTDIWSNLASNVTRIVSLETSNTDIWSNLASNVTRIASLETSNTDIWSNLASNVTRIASLETDLASNALKLTTLTLDDVVNISNITSNTIELTNTTTGLVTTANVSVGRDLAVSGNLTVLGTTTTVDTENLRVGDPIIEIGKDNTAAPIVDLGIVMTRPPGNSNVAIIYDESATKLEIGYTQGSASDSTITMETATANPISLNVNGSIRAGHDQDVTSYLGRAAIGYVPGAPPEVDTTILNSLTVVATADGNKYSLNGVTQPTLYLQKGVTYTGIQASIQQYADHPLKISATPDGTHGGDNTILAAAYSDMGGTIFIPTSPASPDTLYYFCPNHPNMGGMIITGQGSPDAATFAHVDHNTATNFALKQTAAGATHISSTAGQGLSFSIGNIEKARIGSNGDFFVDTDTLYVDTVNDRVGVGTSSPDANLHVEGNAYVSSNLEVSNINFTGSFNQNGTPFESSPWTTTGDDLSYTTGRVGVGTSSPDANLHVEGNARVSSNLEVGSNSVVPIWFQTIDSLTNDNEGGRSIAVDSGGNVYVMGKYESTIDVSLGNNLTLPGTSGPSIFIVKYNSSGTAQWYQTIEGTPIDKGYGIEVDSSGNVYVTGHYFSDYGYSLGNGLVLPSTSASGFDVFIVKYDTSGTAQWYKTISGTSTDIGYSIAVDSGGSVYVTGYYNSTTTVSLGPGLDLPASSGNETFIVKYNSSGTAQWYKTIPGTTADLGSGIEVDSSGNIYVIGHYERYENDPAISLGNGLELPFSFALHVFIVKYDSSGTAQWFRTLPGTTIAYNFNGGVGIAVDSSGSVYVTGYHDSTTAVSLGNNINLPAMTGIYSVAYIVKYDTSGTAQWFSTLPGLTYEGENAIAVDSGGNVCVTGKYYSTTPVSLGNGLELPVTPNDTHIFIVKYDTSGTAQWYQTIPGSALTTGYGIAVDSGGNVYVTGQYKSVDGTVSLGNGLELPVTTYDTDVFIVKYGPTPFFFIDATTARVGIGTSTPGSTLDVAGNVYVSSNLEVSNINFTGSFNQNGTPFEPSPWTTTGDDLSYTTGKVGVGTSSPDANLHVEGNVYVSSNLEVGKVGNSVFPTWFQTIAGSSFLDSGNSIAVDSGGNVYVIGYYDSTTAVSLGNGLNLPDPNGYDVFIVKYDTSGTAQWYQTIRGTSSDIGYGIAVDPSGSVYVTGYYTSGSTVSLGNDLELPVTSGGSDAFIVKYDISGTAQWFQTIRGTSSDIGYGIAVDPSGSVYVTGYYTSGSTVSLGNDLELPATPGGSDAIIVKYDTSGTAQWYQTISGALFDGGRRIAVDSGGNVYVTGYYDSTTAVSLGNGLNLPDPNGTDVFIVKYDTSGTAQWYQTISGTSVDIGYGIAVDSSGSVYVTGQYNSTTTVSLGPSLNLPVSSGTDGFIVKYNSSGTAQWFQTIRGTSSDIGYGIAVDPSGSVYVTGQYTSTTAVSLGSGLELPVSSGTDVFIVKYNSSGTAQWFQTIRGTSSDIGYGIAVDPSGSVYVTGKYYSTTPVSLGSGLELPVSSGGSDPFIVKYNPSPLLFIDATTARVDVMGDINFTGALTQNGTTYGGGSSPWVTSGNDISYTTGGVGIGTNSPQGTLHVSSGTAGDCNLILQADTDNNNEGDNPRIEFWQDGAIQEAAIGMTSNRLNLWNSVSSGAGIAFHTGTVDGWTNAIERMTITSTGDVGIGATVPARLFHVNGTSRFEGEVEWYEAGQNTSHANYGANRDWYIRSGAAGGKVVIQDASTASYVGIGTSSPGYKLDVNGDINLTGSLRIGGVAQTFGGGGGGSGTSPWVTVNLTEIHYSGGNVGIGTSDPAHTLHVEGNIYASGNVTAYSDKRKKTNLRIIEDSVKKLEQINGYTYDKDGTEYTGLIAQEVLHILPQAVVGSEEEGYGLAYGNMVGILVEAIKELSSEVKNLKEKLSV